MDNLKIDVSNTITILKKEVAVPRAMKWYFVLVLTFRKAAHQDDVNDRLVSPKTGFLGINC